MNVMNKLTNTEIKALLATGNTDDRNRVINAFTPDLLRIISIWAKTNKPEVYLGVVVETLIARMNGFNLNNVEFEACLSNVVREALTNAYVDESTIYVPREKYLLGKRAYKWAADYKAEYGEQPSLEEVSKAVGTTPEVIDGIWCAMYTEEMDAPAGDDENAGTKGDFIRVAGDDYRFDRSNFRADLRRCLARLIRLDKITKKAATAFLAYFSPEQDYMDPQLEDVAEELGYNSIPAIRYPIQMVLKAIREDEQCRWILSSYAA